MYIYTYVLVCLGTPRNNNHLLKGVDVFKFQRRLFRQSDDSWSSWESDVVVPTPISMLLSEGTRQHPITVKVSNNLIAAEYRIDPSSFIPRKGE
jgi:hypothetical protein